MKRVILTALAFALAMALLAWVLTCYAPLPRVDNRATEGLER
jgi:hypothetical protein